MAGMMTPRKPQRRYRRSPCGRPRSGSDCRRKAAPRMVLVAKGFRIAARRWRSPVGEIDIVARRGNLLVFVEVKARERFDDAACCGDRAAEAADLRRRRGLARRTIRTTPMRDMRFDAMLVAPRRLPRHIPAAFEVES